MKKIYYILSVFVMLTFSSCLDYLETQPTDKVSGSMIFDNAETAETAINGVYRMLYTHGWSQSWASENGGHFAIVLAANLMAEDHLMASQGNGWFYEDYRLNVHGDYSGKSGRSYSFWNFYYSIIANVNYIIASEHTIGGDQEKVKEIVGQAYAMRSFAYFHLIQLYQQTYNGNQQAPGVPVYTTPTVAGAAGAPRGTVEQVYAQINYDIDYAIELLGSISNKNQSHASHVDYYVANGMKARVCLAQHKYEAAAKAATLAMTMPGKKIITVEELGGNNSIKSANVMWGMEIVAGQGSGYAGMFSYMDADAELYGSRAPQTISKWLHDQIPATDQRQAWFRGKVENPVSGTSNQSYCQIKFKMADYSNRIGDYLFMRHEEMILIKAEAECHQGKFADARQTISTLGNARDTEYASRLEKYTDSGEYQQDTQAETVTLMDEILLQRRIELWGEVGRIFDLQRLGLGYNRLYDGHNHSYTASTKNTAAGSPLFILPLPQSEIDGNECISSDDQNEIVL